MPVDAEFHRFSGITLQNRPERIEARDRNVVYANYAIAGIKSRAGGRGAWNDRAGDGQKNRHSLHHENPGIDGNRNKNICKRASCDDGHPCKGRLV